MDVDWSNPKMAGLHERLAVCIQEQLEQDLTPDGRVAYLPYFGKRAASEIFSLAVDVSSFDGSTSLIFRSEGEIRP